MKVKDFVDLILNKDEKIRLAYDTKEDTYTAKELQENNALLNLEINAIVNDGNAIALYVEEIDKGYMSLEELNEDQLRYLCQEYLCKLYEKEGNGESPSYGEFVNADELVSMEQLKEEYGDISFVSEDFPS